MRTLVGLALLAATCVAQGTPTMPVVRLVGYGDVRNLRLERLPRPVPTDDQVLVRVRAASVNPYDWKFREGHLRAVFEPPMPLTPGLDFAGVVESTGPRGGRWKKGDEVYGFVGEGEGAYARYVLAAPANLAGKPRKMSFEEAAAIPVVALTAWKALFDVGALERGQRVLLNGASGGVGLAAIQLARWKGAQVTAVASAAGLPLMRRYGAEVALDYRTQKVEESVRPEVDLAVDAVNLATAAASIRVLRTGGTLVTLNVPPPAEACAAKDLRCAMLPNFRPVGDAFARVAELVTRGRLHMTVGRTFPLAAAAAAQELSKRGGTAGKIVLRID